MKKFAKKKICAVLSAISLFSASTSSFASIQSDMQSWFNEIGAYGNVTGADILKGQTGTTFTGGNFYMRTPQRNYSPFNIALPGAKAGCGGIDLFAGAFSFMNSEQLTAMLRNLANNAMGVAFELAIQAISPDLSAVLKWAQDLANKTNALNINTCQMATGLVTAAWPDQDKAKALAQRKGLDPNNNLADDSFKAWWSVLTNPPSFTNQQNKQMSEKDQSLRDTLDDINITWEVLNKININDNELRDLMMTMVGAVIVTRNNDDGSKPMISYRKLGDKITVKDFIGDQDVSSKNYAIMTCADMSGKCLSVTTKNVQIPSFANYVKKKLDSIISKINSRTNQGLSDDEYQILQGTNIPVWKLAVMSANLPAAQGLTGSISQAIAADLALTYFNGILKETQKAIKNYKGTDSPTVLEQLRELEKTVSELREESMQLVSINLQNITSMTQLQATVARIYSEANRGLSPNIFSAMNFAQ